MNAWPTITPVSIKSMLTQILNIEWRDSNIFWSKCKSICTLNQCTNWYKCILWKTLISFLSNKEDIEEYFWCIWGRYENWCVNWNFEKLLRNWRIYWGTIHWRKLLFQKKVVPSQISDNDFTVESIMMMVLSHIHTFQRIGCM